MPPGCSTQMEPKIPDPWKGWGFWSSTSSMHRMDVWIVPGVTSREHWLSWQQNKRTCPEQPEAVTGDSSGKVTLNKNKG